MSLKNDIIKYTPRTEQQEALDFIIKTKKEKSDTKFFLLNMPVGVGKSHLAVMISDWYTSKIDKGAKVDIITAGKILQDQYDVTYESIKNLKGKENYSCKSYSTSCANGKEFNRLNKTTCEFCPYDESKNSYMGGRISLTNFHLYLTYAIYNQKMLDQRESSVLIVDECLHPESLISMSDGTQKKIKELSIGEMVKTINEDNGLVENKPIVKVHHNLNKGVQMYEIKMYNGEILKITGNHKVKLTSGVWKKVEDLDIDDEILYIKEKTQPHEFDR